MPRVGEFRRVIARPLPLEELQLTSDRAEGIAQVGADQRKGCDRRHGNQRRDQRIFNGRDARGVLDHVQKARAQPCHPGFDKNSRADCGLKFKEFLNTPIERVAVRR